MTDKTEQIIKVLIDADDGLTVSDIQTRSDASQSKVYRVIGNLDRIDLIDSDKDAEPHQWVWIGDQD